MNEKSPDPQDKLAQIRRAIQETITRLEAVMSAEELEKVLLPLRAEEAALMAELPQEEVPTAVTAQTFWNRFPDRAAPHLLIATEKYLGYLANRYRFVGFRGIGKVEQVPRQLELLRMFVPLKVRPYLPPGETWPRPFEASMENHEPLPLVPLLAEEEGIVLLGDLGAGKTTFLRFLALSLVTGKRVAEGIDGRIPLILPLSAYADQLEKESTLSLQAFFERYFNSLGLPLPLDEMFRTIADLGQGIFLLDGLDEVRDLRLRHRIVEQIYNFFAFHRQAGNRMIVTSRLIGYRDARLVADGLTECTVADLDQHGIETFATRWLLLTSGKAASEVEDELTQLLSTIRQNQALNRLATNPLLLTIMLLMRQDGKPLPHRRVELYDRFVRTLIHDWNLVRHPSRPPESQVTDQLETFHILGPLALWMEQQNPGVGMVQREDLRNQLAFILKYRRVEEAETAAYQFLQDVQQYTGILVDREDNHIAFLHRAFQEYLAAWAVAQRGQSTLTPVIEFIQKQQHDVGWWELLRLAVGILGIVQQREEAAGIVLQNLIRDSEKSDGVSLALVGAMLADLAPSGVPPSISEDVVSDLFRAVRDDSEVTADWRIAIGRSLGRLDEADTIVDEMSFCYVPPGPFFLGERHFEETIDLLDAPYWLGQFPVTNGQFNTFVADDGYERAEFWQEATAVNRWRSGEVMDWQRLGWRQRPYDYGYPFNLSNHPVVGISWYEALAFTRWLDERWKEADFIGKGWQVMLPTELHWEKAAKGGLTIPQLPVTADPPLLISVTDSFFEPLMENKLPKRPFPWGDQLPNNHANFREAEDKLFDESSNLGLCFPKGASPVGCREMSGNVWEWTRSLHKKYPYNPADGRETTDVRLFHTVVVRGGAFWSPQMDIKTVSRAGRSPNTRSDSIGFRVCVMVPNPTD